RLGRYCERTRADRSQSASDEESQRWHCCAGETSHEGDRSWHAGIVVPRARRRRQMETGTQRSRISMSTGPAQQPSLTLEPPPLFDRLRGALLEDLGPIGDITSQSLVPEGKLARADVLVKAEGVICGVNL